jgi:hypothetical protein
LDENQISYLGDIFMRIAFHWFIVVWIILATSAKGEVLYERKETEAELGRYEIITRKWGIGKSEAELRKEVQPDFGVNSMLKIELLYDNSTNPPRPFIQETFHSTNLLLLAAERKWREATGPQLLEGIEFPGLKAGRKEASVNGFYAFQEPMSDFIGCVSQEFLGPGDKRVGINVYEAVGEKTPKMQEMLHEMLRYSIRGHHTVTKMDFGTVVTFKTKWSKLHNYSYVEWVTPKASIISVNAHGVDLLEVANICSKKYPSSLPADLKIDKTTWGREEFESGIQRMKAALDNKDFRMGIADTLIRVTEYVYYPLEWRSKRGDEYKDSWTEYKAKDQQIYDEIVRWWKENKEKTYWDEKFNMLVAKGQTPADIKAEIEKHAKEAAKLAREKNEAILAKPMTNDEIAKAKVSLMVLFEARSQEARWQKVKDGVWTYDYTGNNGSHATLTCTGPTITQTNDRKKPLKAVFVKRTKDPGLDLSSDNPNNKYDPRIKNGAIEELWTYYYSRLENTWRKSESD